MIKYLTFSFSISVISWIIGMVVNAILIKTTYYNQNLTNLNFLKNERVNSYIGIGIFKWIIIHSFFKYFNPKLSMKKKIQPSELPNLRHEMTIAEISHLIGFAFVTAFAIVKIVKGQYLFALIIMIVNILLNLYPTLLQQQNKRRIDKYNRILAIRASNLVK
ncbi:hypothetical protein ASE74_15155 [Pedobacter sp. Leaf216]|uniref:glycosyl-4,4'-diaponeurosporenoate acyltransferase CrtO family protein n=1 Tax=Pedobacter sp. Leaf216 TaxID=1735684 RepID=UPI0006FE7295|nr:hypothetical protein [Pedobacter sp. Leaf216]KQM78048.1 hypothetical protein ASE74_15155 [Pedobacter sp. Leaf216]